VDRLKPSIGSTATWKAALTSIAVLLLTSVHHVYGAIIYQTPWRHHVVLLSLGAMLVLWGGLAVFHRSPGTRSGRLALGLALAVIVGIVVGGIGLFEGGYNHLLKNLLFFGGAPAPLLRSLFPAPTYEMPNDLFFEFTGVLQFFVALLAARDAVRLARAARAGVRDSDRALALKA
jgi:hypothetical protein